MVSPRRSTTMLAFAGAFFTFSLVMQVWVAARPPAQDTSGTEVNERRRQRFTPRGEADEEAAADQMLLETGRSSGPVKEAPAAFDNLRNADPHSAVVGAPHPQSIDARRAVVHPRRRHPAAWRAGIGGAQPVRGASRQSETAANGLSGFALSAASTAVPGSC